MRLCSGAIGPLHEQRHEYRQDLCVLVGKHAITVIDGHPNRRRTSRSPDAPNGPTYSRLPLSESLTPSQNRRTTRAQADKNSTRLSVKLDGNHLWLTPIDSETGKIAAPVTSKYMRVE